MESSGLHTSSGISLRFLRNLFNDRNFDFDQFISSFHLSTADIDDTTKRFDTFVISSIWEEARELFGRPFLHVELELMMPPGAFGSLEYFSLTAPTIGQAIASHSKYADLWNTLFKVSVERRPHEVEVFFTSSDPFYDLDDLMLEFSVCAILRRLRPQCKKKMVIKSLNFAHPRTSRESDYEQAFGLIPHFECERSSVVIPIDTWNTGLYSSNESLHAHLGVYLEALSRQFRGTHSDIIGRVRHYVFTNIGECEISIGEASKFLGLSPRSLQRALREMDTTFSAVIDEVKQTFALKWVREEKIDFGEVASRLGFNDQSAFLKAYRRWTGSTPGEDRRRHSS